MGKRLKRAVAASSALALGLTLAACGGDSGSGGSANEEAGKKGGTLHYLQSFLYESVDPQRIYYGVELANFRRVFYRGLVAFPMDEDAEKGNTPVADLATDTGTPTKGGAQWEFTLKDGVKWEDGTDITCEDVQYGTSRVFANDLITGGPNYTLSYIDVKDYPGPYKATPAQQKAFEEAVSCDGKTITFKFNKPWADFNQAAAGMMMVDPYKKSFDQGDKSKWKVLSNGPYKLEGGEWDKNKGGTLVRNENYDPATDSPDELRKALPDKIEWTVNGSDTAGELFNERLIKDSGDDQYAITSARLAPNQLSKVQSGPVNSRYLNVVSPYTDYFAFNHKKVTNPKVREALAVSMDTEGYIKANGGELVLEPADSIVNPGVNGYQANPAFEGISDGSGDPDAAKALLKEAGVKTPLDIKLSYPKTPTADKAMTVLKDQWDDSGFNIELDGQGDTYYDVMAKPNKDTDILWAGWGADWPSAMTVIPPLFDSRPNISKTTCGNDYGCYEDADLNKLLDEAANASDIDEQVSKIQEADEYLGKQYAYVPIDNQKFNWLRGSKVTGFTTTPASNGYPEMGLIGVSD